MGNLNATEEKVIDLVEKYAIEDLDGALELVTGLFVGLMTTYMELNDQDPNTELVISGNGEGQRKITLHRKGEQ